ncbi:MAG: ScpA family protein [Gemmataceae bacterium]
MDYLVDLDTFRGPMDLLLYLVKRNEVDIYDIPIAKVAEQFRDYLLTVKLLDVERAGEFIVMAATLMEIKSRMLLPRSEEEQDDEEDPRLELVRQLIEYKKYKDAALALEERAEQQLTRLARRPVEGLTGKAAAEQPLAPVELWDLVSAFGRLMRETQALQPRQIVVDETPIETHMENILVQLQEKQKLEFIELFTPPFHRARLVGLFLALLELIKSRRIKAEQENPFGMIYLVLMTAEEARALGPMAGDGPTPAVEAGSAPNATQATEEGSSSS